MAGEGESKPAGEGESKPGFDADLLAKINSTEGGRILSAIQKAILMRNATILPEEPIVAGEQYFGQAQLPPPGSGPKIKTRPGFSETGPKIEPEDDSGGKI